MTSIPARELRNDISEVLRRVERGERLTVTVSGRPVAQLVPLSRPRWVDAGRFLQQVRAAPADRQLLDDLRALNPDTTDDLPL